MDDKDKEYKGLVVRLYKPLKIVKGRDPKTNEELKIYTDTLSSLAVAEASLVAKSIDSALPHFIAIVKELERVLDFHFEKLEEGK